MRLRWCSWVVLEVIPRTGQVSASHVGSRRDVLQERRCGKQRLGLTQHALHITSLSAGSEHLGRGRWRIRGHRSRVAKT